jgi:predicted metalloprotease with PDZ domain
MIDILVRDGSNNARSLDDVMKAVYRDSYLGGRGFTEEQWWRAVSEAAGGLPFEAFEARYIDGREPYPWSELLPLAGLRLRADVTRVPRIGITSQGSDQGVRVAGVAPGGAGATAGVQAGDILITVAGVDVGNTDFGAVFRANFAGAPPGTPYDIVVERAGQRLTLTAEVRFEDVTSYAIEEDPAASPKAVRIRNGLLTGATGS